MTRLHTAIVTLALFISAGTLTHADPPELPKGYDTKRYMPVEEIRPGMKGYGMSVFHGIEPEPFAVEVISVEQGFNPGKSVIWVRCTDERMQKSGPVSGMSGSPIYLWAEGEAGKLGEGGRMIGAFAFGYGWGKDCFAGIQPIGQMIEAGNRGKAMQARGEDQARHSVRTQTMPTLLAMARKHKLPDEQAWTIQALARLTADHSDTADDEPGNAIPRPTGITLNDDAPAPARLSLPVMVGSVAAAEILQPLFARHGLTAVASRANLAAAADPPVWLKDQRDQTQLKPGSVISVPIATGAVDLAATGTVTEVLPDGTVLGFGHAFMGQGAISAPIATGYVHFIQPSYQNSFKISGSLKIVGALVNDEFAAIVGRPDAKARMIPVTVDVTWPDATKNGSFTYQASDLPAYQSFIIPYLGALSIGADTEMPDEATLISEATLKFEGGHEFKTRQTHPFGNAFSPIWQVSPIVATLTENPYQSLKLESASMSFEIVDAVKQFTLTRARLRSARLSPGETAHIDLSLRTYQQETTTRTLELKIPDDAPEGQYRLIVGGGNTYAEALFTARPYLQRVENIDQLIASVKAISEIRDDRIYAMLTNGEPAGVALGRTPMEDMPPSRLAMFARPNDTMITPIIRVIENQFPIDGVLVGSANLELTIVKK